MPIYSIRRDVGPISREELDAAAFRALICALEYDGLRWVRSFWDRRNGRLDCIYEAQDEAQIREHSLRANIPCDDVHEVLEVWPETYIGSGGAPVSAAPVGQSA